MKRIITIILIVIVCLLGLYTFLTWNGGGNPRFMHHRYNRVITEPLAKLGFTDAQFKMGAFWFYGAGESTPTTTEIENAIYWWEKAAAQNNDVAVKELAKAKTLLYSEDRL